MKVRSKNENIKATRVFTDREEPRAAFWKNYERCEAEMTNDGKIHVLTYYGIGGIGKSRLLKKLMSEMDERFSDKRYVYFDFNIHQESRAVLTALKNKLTEQCKFTFPLFELGSYMYAKKVGGNPDAPEIQQMTEKSPFLSLVLSIAGNIPMLGFATSMLSLADQCVAYVRTYLKNHSRELKQIEYMEAEELYRLLPYLFAQDLTHNQEHSGKLLVVLLDTYERLVNELSSTGDPLMNDLWIRGKEGLIQNIPNVLWVIAGREKLKWERFDPDWAEALEQHILGNLSLADSDSFLSAAGVGGSKLRQQLYELTNGTPVYLDLCVDQFTRLSAKGILPEISMFGQNTHELIERFIRYMSDSQKDLVYTLACLQMWNDDLIMQIAGAVLPNFSLSTYEKAKDFSFIIQSGDNWYNIHQTVGEVLVAHCPKLLKEKICQKIIDHFTKAIETQNVCGEDYPTSLTYIVRAGLMRYHNLEEFRFFYLRSVEGRIVDLIDAGYCSRGTDLIDLLLAQAKQNPSSLFYADILYLYATFLYDTADPEQCIKFADSSIKQYQSFFPKNDSYVLRSQNLLALALNAGGQYHRALEILKYLQDQYRTKTGDNDQKILGVILHNMGQTYLHLGQYDKALKITEQVIVLESSLHGENHSRTLNSKAVLAEIMCMLGRYEEGLSLEKDILRQRRETLGDYHRDTINSANNLGFRLCKLGRYEEALPLYQESLEKRRILFGNHHLDTIIAMNNLGVTLFNLKRYENALILYEESFAAHRALLGNDHPNTIYAMTVLANTFNKLNQHNKALPLHQEALAKHRSLQGENDPDTINATNNLANTLYYLKRYHDALPLYEEVLSKRRKLLGSNHPHTLQAMQKLHITLIDLQQYKKAIALGKELLPLQRKILGDNHRDTVATMRRQTDIFMKSLQ